MFRRFFPSFIGPMAKQLTTLNNTQLAIENAANTFRDELQKSANNALRRVVPLFRRNLEVEEPIENQQVGRVANSEANRELVIEAFDLFVKSLATPTLQARIDTITDMFTAIAQGVGRHYTRNFGQPSVVTLNEATNVTQMHRSQWTSFTVSGIRFEVVNPVLAEWQDMLGTATLTEFINRTEYLIGDKLVTYVAPRGHAAMQNHYREMSNLFGQGFDLVWVKYVRETSTAERRPFCVAHESGFQGNRTHYHIDEVKNTWPDWEEPNYTGQGNWSGQIAGTNSDTILENGGGYNCLHSFRYVNASEVSPHDRRAARENGAIIPF